MQWRCATIDRMAAVVEVREVHKSVREGGVVRPILAGVDFDVARGEAVDSVLEALSRGLTHKMLHGALAELHASDGADRMALADTVERLFLRRGSRSLDGGGRS